MRPDQPRVRHGTANNMQTLRAACQLLYEEADRAVLLYLGGAVLLVGLGGLFAGLAPLALKEMIDSISAASAGPDWTIGGPIAALGAAYVAALFVGRLLTELRPLIGGRAEQRLIARLTRRFFAQLLDMKMSFHLRQPGGSVLQSLFQANAGSQFIIGHVVGSFLPVLIEIGTTVVVLVHLEQPSLVVAFCLTSAVYVLIFANGAAPLMASGQAVSDASQRAHAVLAESLLNCETLKCYGAEGEACRRLAVSTEGVELAWHQLQRLRTRTGTYAAAAFALAMTASLLLAADALRSGTLSLGGFVLANVYMLQIFRPLETMGTAVRDVAQALGFLRPLLTMLEEPRETATDAQSSVRESRRASASIPNTRLLFHGDPPPHIRMDEVRFGYDAIRPVLVDLSIDLAPGRSVGIVGASGSGKSSVVKLLLRLHDPQDGHILLDGLNIALMDVKELRGRIAVVTQDTALLNGTIANNIALGRPDASQAEIERAARLACLHDFVLSLPSRYESRVGERGLQLSGGERQRIAIARALLKRSRLYLFDEATSMLDSTTESKIVGNLNSALLGCSTITIAHRLSTLMRSDEILVMHAGRVVERGTHQDLISQDGRYANMWRLQANRPEA